MADLPSIRSAASLQPHHHSVPYHRDGKRVVQMVPWRSVSRALLVISVVLLLAVGPAAAQDGATNPVCADESNTLANMLEGFVQITTGLGIMGLLVVWQADALMEMLTITREQKAKLKQHKRGAMRSAATLVVLGPLFTVGSTAMGLPIASCVDLVPF